MCVWSVELNFLSPDSGFAQSNCYILTSGEMVGWIAAQHIEDICAAVQLSCNSNIKEDFGKDINNIKKDINNIKKDINNIKKYLERKQI
ncbi:hypothetical protein DUI87_06987 [Hirundo rustica rustica]|uniref:Uncharacterized protein n=1 Tax=Hirundo rustica rustica TaxID=333673 RepID=A0A3M0KQD5_HIRRU|nr:hypothetical protein DUI87_06987 [Hirundo rustica rustica]